MTAKLVLNTFDVYQKARVSFAQTTADLASQPGAADPLVEAGALQLLPPLLNDIAPGVQHSAALALGRLANHSARLAHEVARRGVLPVLLSTLRKQNRYYKKAAMMALRSVAKHSADLAQLVVDEGGLDAILLCLEDFDALVKETAVVALGHIAKHNRLLAQAGIDAGVAPLLVLCLQEPETNLRQVAAYTISEICRHTGELAQALVDAEAVSKLAILAKSLSPKPSAQLRDSLKALAVIAQHSAGLAETVAEADVFPDVLTHLVHPDQRVRVEAARLVREVVKQTDELALLVVNYGGVGALLQLIGETKGTARLHTVMALGFIAAQSEHLAYCLIQAHTVHELGKVLESSDEDHVTAGTAWALGQLGKHSPEHAKALAEAGIYPELLKLVLNPDSSADLAGKARAALKDAVRKCMDMDALQALVKDAPPDILKQVMAQFSKILPNDPVARKMFVTSGGLRRVQEMEAPLGSTLLEHVLAVQACFPEELVRFYSPGYSQTLLERVASFQPVCQPAGLATGDNNMSRESQSGRCESHLE